MNWNFFISHLHKSYTDTLANEEKIRKVFKEEIIPVVKKQKGNIDIMLLHPFKENDEHISYTSWKSKEDAEAYHSSGTYKKLVDKVKELFLNQPTLKSYISA